MNDDIEVMVLGECLLSVKILALTKLDSLYYSIYRIKIITEYQSFIFFTNLSIAEHFFIFNSVLCLNK